MDYDIHPVNRYEMSNSETIIKAVENVGISILPKDINFSIPTNIKFIDQVPGLPIKRKYVMITNQPHSEVIQHFAYLTQKAFNRVDSI